MNFFRNVELINKVNLTGQIEPIRDELIDDIILSRSNRREGSYNFEVNTKHNKYLYDLFIERSKRLLNKFTLKDTDFKLWCYYTDKDSPQWSRWHNHYYTTTINGVLYLEAVKGYGLEVCTDYNETYLRDLPVELYINREKKYIELNNYDLLIFPDFLEHRPLVPPRDKHQRRITLNFEVRCNESSKEIFNIS